MSNIRKLKVFICHSSNDKPEVRDLYRQMAAETWIDPWLDEVKLFPGQDWDFEIVKAVETADVVIACISNNSVTKEGYIQKELKFVLDLALEKPEGTIFVIPLRLDDCPLPRRLKSWQSVDYFPESNRTWAYQRVVESLKLRANSLMGLPANENPVLTLRLLPPNIKRYLAASETPETGEKKPNGRLLWALVPISVVLACFCVGLFVVGAVLVSRGFPASPISTRAMPTVLVVDSTPAQTPSSATPDLPLTLPPAAAGATSTSLASQTIQSPASSENSRTGKDGMSMLIVSAGSFEMGSTSGDDDEKPVHTVTLDAFWIDRTEVTNQLYAACVAAGVCETPSSNRSVTRTSYYGNPAFGDYPVTQVSWNDARAYCKWVERRLPTEAEWEKAARGTDGRMYPWGFGDPTNEYANFVTFNGDTVKVGSYPAGASPYGALDMAGNVWEWVSDWYSGIYYGDSALSNPLGPDSGQMHVVRGGSWFDGPENIRNTSRNKDSANDKEYRADKLKGFRCAASP
jgi:formylglycine-generating enzyme required for sulfatase activity